MEPFGSLLGMLAAVIGILFLSYWVTKWIARAPFAAGRAGDGDFTVLRQWNLGRTERLILIRLHTRCLLLGVTASQVTLVTELTPEEAAPFLAPPEATLQPPRFWDVLQKNRKK